MTKKFIYIFLFFILIIQGVSVQAQRFPKPEFENGHTQPEVQKPEARSTALEYFDIFVLLASLSVVSWLVLKKRSRRGVLYMSLFSIAYFGFFREGCICSVGSLQNISLALFNPNYVIPISAILFFALPLIFTLFFGRTFCAGVCPLGAIQDIVAIKPIEIKPWLQKTLGILPFVYLGLAVLYAATASDFVICRYDPFIGIYRLDGTFTMFIIGGILLLIGVFIARPYCRFLCPYGVLLNWVSRFSKKHLTITPASCIQCKLCENSCPFGAIEKPVPEDIKLDRKTMIFRFIGLSIIIPLLIIIGGWAGSQMHEVLAKVNPKVRMANEMIEAMENPKGVESLNIESFKSSGKSASELYEESAAILKQFERGSWILGAFIGLVIGISLASLSILRYREDYEPNRGDCLSCARCVDFCPVKSEGDELI
ncbi:MAG: 4Fe-4S binding protein [Salinivirgaceae bacterium]|jgi:NosR/NirI family nitrous oxide reductase transcriptional regulator|nr:4Fe-4S binding protein [Salinivirgaceae bacterium]